MSKKPDKGHEMTEDLISDLEKKIHSIYAKANEDMVNKTAAHLQKYEAVKKQKEQTLSKKDFETWKKNQAHIIANQDALVKTLADDMVNTDQIAMNVINGHTPSAYALNYNFATYQIESAAKASTSFAMYNANTVELLMLYDDSYLLPHEKVMDIPKDLQWNRKHINTAITQGVLQGESIPKIAKRLSEAVGMDERAAVRNARTAMTGAQNGGRVDAYMRAKALGIDVKQQWSATFDQRTRQSHRALDGETVEIGKPFSNKCKFPGDPAGPGYEVYNCRCTLIPIVKGFDNSQDWKKEWNGYNDWKGIKPEPASHTIINGKDISGTWVRRPDQFDFEIEDIISAQGFDGMPRVVSPEEFDEMVKQANDGNGFIAQRTYSAPDQETLDLYRNQLYHGKWYVDCSTGGAAHGKGMYVVGNEEGKITDKIKSEMLGYGAGNKFSYIETFTIDPSTKFIDEKDINSSLYSKLGMNLTKKYLSDFDLSDDELKFIAAYRGLASDYTPFVSEFMSNPKTNAKAMELMQKMMTDEKMSKRLNDAFDDFLKISSDQGNVAALFGYDGIKCSGGQDYYVILNRTKLIIKGDHKKAPHDFNDWLNYQADPHVVSKFGNKSMNAMYNELKEQGEHNAFYTHLLKPMGKPSEVWKQYIDGTLDAANTKKIDDFLFKHFDLNDGKLEDLDDHALFLSKWKDVDLWADEVPGNAFEYAVKNAPDADHIEDYWKKYTLGEIKDSKLDELLGYEVKTEAKEDVSNIIKEAESKINITKGSPMSTADADNHKVNPLYNTDDKASKTNCQTCSFVYECRKQGYDVVALPTYDSDSFKDIYHLQVEISHDSSVAWINKTTGKAPKSLYKGSPDYDTINKLVGNSGERYIFGVKFDGANGHSINLDRDSKGNLRIIDNQRGPKEKNTWTGQKEIEEYFEKLDKVNGIEELVRVDDCVPNAKYLNAIAQDAKKIKNVDPYKNLNHFSEQLPIAEIAKKKGFDAEDYYNKWRLGLVEDKDLDAIMNIKSKTVDVTPKVSKIDLDAIKNKTVTNMYNELKEDKQHGKFYGELKKIGQEKGYGTQGDVWKKYLAGELNDEDTAKIDKYLTKYKKSDVVDEVLDKSNIPNKLFITKMDTDTFSDIFDMLEKKGINNKHKYYSDWYKGLIDDKDLDDYWSKHSINKIEDEVDKVDDLAEIKKSIPKTLTALSHDDINVYNDVQSIISSVVPSNMTKTAYWNEYLNGEIDNAELDDAIKKYSTAKKVDKVEDKIDDIAEKNAQILNYYKDKPLSDAAVPWDVAQECHSKYLNAGCINPYDYWNKYKAGKIKDAEIDKILGIKKIDNISDAKISDIAKIDKSLLPDTLTDLYVTDNTLYHEVTDEIAKHASLPGVYYKDYLDGKVQNSKLDEIFAKSQQATKATDTTKPFSKKDLSVDYGSYGKFIGAVADIDHYGDTYQEIVIAMKELKTPYGITFNNAYKKYINGEIESDKLDDLLSKIFSDKHDDTSATPEVDLSTLSKKKVSHVYNELKADGQHTKFWNQLGEIGQNYNTKQAGAWDLYLNGKLTDAEKKKIDDLLIHKYNKGGTKTPEPSAEDLAKKAEQEKKLKAAEKKLKKAEEDLDTAKQDLKAAQKALDDLDTGEVWVGIWKDDVSIKDYEAKKSTIKAKKVYYDEEIDKLKNDPDYKSWLSAEQKQEKIDNLVALYDDLEEFEVEGEKYLKAAKPFQQDIDKAQKVVDDAQDVVNKAKKEVADATPTSEMFSQERKDAALWAKDKTKDYKRADKVFDPHAREVHATRTKAEYDAYKDYTSASGPFNKPLVGFDSPDGSGKSGWTEQYWKGSGNVDIDKRGRGDNIRALTTLVEKSTYDFDFWMQTSQDFSTFEGFGDSGFLGIPYGTLQHMSNAELQQFVGKQNKLPQFISGAINKGGGSYNPGKVRMNIYVPKGSEALYVLEDGTFGKGEHEIILQRGGTYRVTKIYWGEDTVNGGEKLIIDVELRLEEGYDKFQQNKK